MELFSLGVGHYTETDIREAARAFTGWRTDGERFQFDARLHDGGPKTVLGQTGAWDGVDVVRIVLEQPAVAQFLVRKLYRFLVSERTTPSDSLLEPLCESFREATTTSPRWSGPSWPRGTSTRAMPSSRRSRDRSSTCWGRCRRSIGDMAKRKRTTGRCRSRR